MCQVLPSEKHLAHWGLCPVSIIRPAQGSRDETFEVRCQLATLSEISLLAIILLLQSHIFLSCELWPLLSPRPQSNHKVEWTWITAHPDTKLMATQDFMQSSHGVVRLYGPGANHLKDWKCSAFFLPSFFQGLPRSIRCLGCPEPDWHEALRHTSQRGNLLASLRCMSNGLVSIRRKLASGAAIRWLFYFAVMKKGQSSHCEALQTKGLPPDQPPCHCSGTTSDKVPLSLWSCRWALRILVAWCIKLMVICDGPSITVKSLKNCLP